MPLVSQTFDQLLDFTRTTSGTFVGSNGLVQTTPASVNLLLWTQQFDNAAWAKTGTTVTANTTAAPDGTSTADTLTASAGASIHRVGIGAGVTLAISNSCTHSIYVKAGSYNFVQIHDGASGSYFVNFNLTTGVVGTSANCTATITDVGNGWYRCTMSFTVAVANPIIALGLVSSASAARNESWTAAGTETVFIWGAQTEASATATTYTRNNGGVFPPRFDYDPVTLAPKGILIEEQRVNLLTYSNDFTNGVWAKVSATLTTGISDPAGGTSATTVTATALSAIQQAPTIATGTYSISVWIRRRTGTGQVSLRCGDLTLIPITVTSSWVRYTATAVATTTTVRLAVILDVSGDEVDIWGAQLEAGAFATSYIPTVASQVTRTADICSIVAPNFAPWYNQSEGTFVVSVLAGPTSLTDAQTALYVSDATAINLINIRRNTASNVASLLQTSGGSGAGLTPLSPVTSNSIYKNATAYALNNANSATNGTLATLDTVVSTPVVDRLFIGINPAGPVSCNGHIRSVTYYPVRLSDAQLQALTA